MKWFRCESCQHLFVLNRAPQETPNQNIPRRDHATGRSGTIIRPTDDQPQEAPDLDTRIAISARRRGRK